MRKIKDLTEALFYILIIAYVAGAIYWRYTRENKCGKKGGIIVGRFAYRKCIILRKQIMDGVNEKA